ncbi:hypothetical protein [Pelotomaculum propionicicum]|uniref:Uncharacterized protein n=1 Tax=Pelotomaculum propionicicum TaxID=258475 RepID=A0A4Y7RC43_9FIRM|nr:hypothetical protein [Pelotomaculum propionicicum]NLI13895.1 hypothetical protein [Peptococcaceae bacterium]TEB06290.1 hypothetical protein Pmgp_03793 [Pelotomaculum propionicicum]
MTKDKKVIEIRQRMIDRILAEEEYLRNLSHHLGASVDVVKEWITESYTDEMLRSMVASLDRLEKAKEMEKENPGSLV